MENSILMNVLSSLPLLIASIISLMVGLRIIPKRPKDIEKYELWYSKFGKIPLYLGILLLIFFVLGVFGVI